MSDTEANDLSFEDYSQIGYHPNIQSQPPGGMVALCISWPFGPNVYGYGAFSTALAQYGPLSSNVTSGGILAITIPF